MSEQQDSVQVYPDDLVPTLIELNAERDTSAKQATPWYQACTANAVPALSTLAAAALVNLPDLIILVYGGGGGGGGPKGH